MEDNNDKEYIITQGILLLIIVLGSVPLIWCLVSLYYDLYFWIINNKEITIGGVVLFCGVMIYFLSKNVTPLRSFARLTSIQKVIKSIIILFLTVMILLAVQYICYVYNLHQFDTSNIHYQSEINEELRFIEDDIKHSHKFKNKYSEILASVDNSIEYDYIKENDEYHISVDSFAVRLIPMYGLYVPQVYIVPRSREVMEQMKSERNGGVYVVIEDEKRYRDQPYSRGILESIKNDCSIKAKDLRQIMCEKQEYYTDRAYSADEVLLNKKLLGLSFLSYLRNSILSSNDFRPIKPHWLVSVLSFIQIIVITFFSGYIYKHLYKILDRE